MSSVDATDELDWRELVGPLYWADVGSRGGFHDMSLLHPLVHMYSFDADAEAAPISQQFASLNHFPFALYSCEGEGELFIANSPGMTSLLNFDEDEFSRYFGLVPGSKRWKRTLELKHKGRTHLRKADDVFRSEDVDRIDFFKLDTQGTELEILKGAQGYLSAGRISVIKTEVSFVPVYSNQCLFGDIDSFLKKHGFVFVDCVFYPDGVYPQTREKAITGLRLVDEPRFSAVGDAIYVLNPSEYPESARDAAVVRSAVMLNQLGYVSFAFDMLSRGAYSKDFAERLLHATAMRKTRKSLLRDLLKSQLPPWAFHKALSFYRSLTSRS